MAYIAVWKWDVSIIALFLREGKFFLEGRKKIYWLIYICMNYATKNLDRKNNPSTIRGIVFLKYFYEAFTVR